MAENIERIVTMVILIPEQPHAISVAELVRALGKRGFAVSRRMIERDLRRLAKTRLALQCDGRRPAGWSWKAGEKLMEMPVVDS